MKKVIIILMVCCLVLSAPLLGLGQEEGEENPEKRKKRTSEVRYFSKYSFFVYGMTGLLHFEPPVEYWSELGADTDSTVAGVFGLGYRLVHFGNRIYLNLTADYIPSEFNGLGIQNQKITYLTFMLDAEARFGPQGKWSAYLGIGVSSIRLKNLGYWNTLDEFVEIGDETITPLVLELGIKAAITKRLMLRIAYRGYAQVDYSDDYYYDEYYGEYDESNLNYLSGTLLAGLEFHF